MPSRSLVVDANILVRAVLGRRVRQAEEHVARLAINRGGDPEKAIAFLRSLGRLMELIGSEVYGKFETEARERLGARDPDDWPILASALVLACPIWTEDTDFFGCGVATWTSNRVQMFLRK